MKYRTLGVAMGGVLSLAALAACGGDGGTSTDTTSSIVVPGSGRAEPSTSAPVTTDSPTITETTTAPATTVAAPRGPRPDGPAPLTFPDGMGSAEGDGVFPRTVRHHKGETVLTAEPKRIVAIGTGQTDVLLTLGIVPVAAVARDGAETVQPYLATAYPELAGPIAEVISVGTNSDVNFEAIAAAQPDLILDNGGAQADTYEQLSAIAPTVITAGTGVNWKQDFRLIASAIGRAGDAEQFMADYGATAGALAAAVADDPPTVSFVRFNTGRARMFGVPSFAGSIAWDAGLERPASQQFDKTSQDLSEELIADVDADWLFYSVQGDPAATPFDAFAANPLWSNLEVIQADHAVVVEDDPWYLSAGPTAARIVLDGLSVALATG